jgi:hypothetical protein
MTASGRRKIILGVVVLAACALAQAQLKRGHDWGGDFSAYIMQAQSLIDGDPGAYVEANGRTVTQDSIGDLGPVAYPWGFPILLAPYLLVFGLNPLLLKTVNLVFFAGSLVLLALYASRRQETGQALAVLTVFAFSPAILALNDSIVSDVPFLFFCLWAVYRIDSTWSDGKPGSTWSGVWTGSVIGAAFLVRTHGLLLLAALVISQANHTAVGRKDAAWKRASPWTYGAPYLAFGLLVLTSGLLLPAGGGGYLGMFDRWTFEVLRSNASYYATLPTSFFFGVPLPGLLYAATLPFLVLGLISRRNRDPGAVTFLVLSLLLLLVWPARQGLRFLLPVIPFYLYLVVCGVTRGMQWLPSGRRKAVAALAYAGCATVLFFFLQVDLRRAAANLQANRERSGPFDAVSSEMFEFVKGETTGEAVILFFKPRVMRLMTGRDAIRIDMAGGLNLGTLYVHNSERTRGDQLAPEELDRLAQDEGKLEMIFDNDGFEVYRIERD